ncbi:MAG: UDP-N-acetylmuramate dehydrogenase [bacterium]
MRLFSDLPEICRADEPMARHTSFRVGGPVRYFLEPRDWDEVDLVYRRCQETGLRLRVLGRGCNTLVTDGPHACAVVSTRRFTFLKRKEGRLEAGAGLDLATLLSRAERWGLAGFEGLAGIPGTVGGAVAMNAGGRHGAIGDRLVSAVVAFPGQRPHGVSARELGLAYRRSALRGGLPLLLSAHFELDRAPSRAVRQRRLDVLARKRAAQPMRAWSAGCVFKNPPGPKSAGQLIDECGLKGTRVGGAVVARKHANFILNTGDATSDDILRLIDLVAQRVKAEHGIELELEIEIWDDEERSDGYGRA